MSRSKCCRARGAATEEFASARNRGGMGTLGAVLVAALGTVACAEPVQYADWTIPVLEDISVREHPVASLDARGSDRIEFHTDLVISDATGERPAAFFNPRDLVVDEDGRIYVLDAGNHRVQVFDGAGDFLNSFGNQGQGPGEFMMPTTIALVDEGVLINDVVTGRLSLWSREGEHLDDHEHERRFRPRVVFGDRDSLLVGYIENPLEPVPRNVTARVTLNGEEIERVSQVPVRGRIRVQVSDTVSGDYAEGFNSASLSLRADTQPRFARGRGGALYLAAGDEYQLLALGPDGAPNWALRGSLPMPEMPTSAIDEVIEGTDRTSSRSDYEWDELLPAIESIRVDGHGHVWVYPTVPEHLNHEHRLDMDVLRPVDVYSADGELLFSGSADPIRWHVSLEDFVYVLVGESQTGEPAVVRYRLDEPF